MQQGCDLAGSPQLNLEEWVGLVHSIGGGNHKVTDRHALAGWTRPVRVYGQSRSRYLMNPSSGVM